ncbi:MAG: cache domain-containing protein [Termitinemataceae bacterium]|nr:MAG: cache domain-containing protein [Termitinemataceae bacterium]
MKVSKRVALLVGLVVVFVAAGISVTAISVASKALMVTTEKALTNQGFLNARLVKVSLDTDLSVLQEISNRSQVRTMDWEEQRAALRADVERIGVLDLAIVSLDGTARYVKEGNQANLGDRDYTKKALAGQPTVSDIIISKVIGKAVLMLAVPIFGRDGQVVGALVARKDAGALNDITAGLNIGENGYFFMINPEGTYTAHPNTKLVLEQFNPIQEAAKDPAYKDFARMLTESLTLTEGLKFYRFDKQNMVAAFVPIEGMPWKLFINVERKEYLSGVAHIQITLILLSVAFFAFGIALAYLIGLSLAKPIAHVANTLKDIAQGDGDLTVKISVRSNDEIGDLAKYFNSTIEKIQKLIAAIKNQTVLLGDIGDDLSLNMTTTASAINEITTNIQSIKTRVENQSTGVNETTEQAEEISGSASKLEMQIDLQSAAVQKSTSAIEELLASVSEVTKTLVQNADNVTVLAEASDVGRAGLQQVAANISEIAKESEGLLEINDVIKRIASQTNLLSMNAAIEAAHAGEAGRGFAVVADEIRKLAESSSEQSSTISAVLKKITEEIQKIMRSTDAVLNKFEAIDSGIKTVSRQEEHIRTAMEEQSEGSQQILEAITQVNTVTQEVKNNSALMTEASRKIEQASRTLQNMTTEISNGVTEMANGADQINAAVTNVGAISGNNKDSIATLVKEVSRFKIDAGDTKIPVEEASPAVLQASKKRNSPQTLNAEGITASAFVPYEWDDSLSVGQEMIDTQHQELFVKINTLLQAMYEGKGEDELKTAMDFLNDYTIKHFFEEEQLQKKYEYPDFENHHNLHEQFKATLRELFHELLLKGVSEPLLQDVKRKVAGWLIAHIKVQDARLSAYLKSTTNA